MDMQEHSHSRKNLLTGEWVLVSPHRMQRPWQGQIEKPESTPDPDYLPDCYLCPGNKRANDQVNASYKGTFVFDNDFPALSPTSQVDTSSGKMFNARSESGRCRVVCYTEKHNLRLSTMDAGDIAAAIEAIGAEFAILDQQEGISYVQIFENRGEMMGCSNRHPHAQIWATEHLPNEPAMELLTQRAWFQDSGSQLLADYREAELADRTRVVVANEHFVVLVPYWAIWPFETLILPQRSFSAPDEMTGAEVKGLAGILKAILSAYDELFATSAPYSMGFHPRPSTGDAHPEWLFHAHIYPPLLRSATIRKHLVGFEMLGMPQRDLTPEVAAARLRSNLS